MAKSIIGILIIINNLIKSIIHIRALKEIAEEIDIIRGSIKEGDIMKMIGMSTVKIPSVRKIAK